MYGLNLKHLLHYRYRLLVDSEICSLSSSAEISLTSFIEFYNRRHSYQSLVIPTVEMWIPISSIKIFKHQKYIGFHFEKKVCYTTLSDHRALIAEYLVPKRNDQSSILIREPRTFTHPVLKVFHNKMLSLLPLKTETKQNP